MGIKIKPTTKAVYLIYRVTFLPLLLPHPFPSSVFQSLLSCIMPFCVASRVAEVPLGYLGSSQAIWAASRGAPRSAGGRWHLPKAILLGWRDDTGVRIFHCMQLTWFSLCHCKGSF